MLQDLGIILLDLLLSRKDSDAAGVDLTPQLNVSLLPLSTCHLFLATFG